MISKAELSRKANISRVTITRIEQGKQCRMETKRKVLLALGYKISDKNKIFCDQANKRHLCFLDFLSRQRGILVASNFKIFSFETSDSLHLKLDGDFDGNSAHELLNTLKKHGDGFYQIFIDTEDLKAIHPFGKEVFQKKLGALKKQFYDIIFVGRNGHEIATDQM